MTPEQRLALAAAANRAPSVHNIQPARFRFDDARTITLMEDQRRRLHIGDPLGKDNQKSLGAAAEGLVLALSEQGHGVEIALLDPKNDVDVREIARMQVMSRGAPDALATFAATRASFRGGFAKAEDRDHAALAKVAEHCPDLCIIEARDAVSFVAELFDDVSMQVLRDDAYRAELVSWMRLSKRDANYLRDGLNAEHMALSPVEAFGAGVVLGKAFAPLDHAHLARPLVAEGPKVKSTAGVALFHRPVDEPEFETGRRFYRVWLEIERAGLALCPMSVLADVPEAAARLLDQFGVKNRKLVTVFRIGRRPDTARQPARVRLPAQELIVPA
jgi:hypothetical protein